MVSSNCQITLLSIERNSFHKSAFLPQKFLQFSLLTLRLYKVVNMQCSFSFVFAILNKQYSITNLHLEKNCYSDFRKRRQLINATFQHGYWEEGHCNQTTLFHSYSFLFEPSKEHARPIKPIKDHA